MARRPPSKPVEAPVEPKPPRDWFLPVRLVLWFVRPFVKFSLIILLISTALVSIYKWVNPPLTYYMYVEFNRLGVIRKDWRDLEDMSIYIPLAVAAAEDANFCDHNGFDFDAIETAIEGGSGRGASTISQQVAKNVFLWPGRSWARKGLETGITVLIESLWSKRRIMEVYLNVVEFDEGVFGVDAAIGMHFGYSPENFRVADAARLAVVLPNPKERAAGNLSGSLKRRASGIAIGATTLRDEGRADCFLPKASP
ncbi:MAG: monofunctional biosynthetic peptidoglycan transglycosylase [Rhodobacteraceae bacterium]|nr:monofunctional biosynthetic peptidoglycan transglycosylase [Paracoccaceae bacterium]